MTLRGSANVLVIGLILALGIGCAVGGYYFYQKNTVSVSRVELEVLAQESPVVAAAYLYPQIQIEDERLRARLGERIGRELFYAGQIELARYMIDQLDERNRNYHYLLGIELSAKAGYFEETLQVVKRDLRGQMRQEGYARIALGYAHQQQFAKALALMAEVKIARDRNKIYQEVMDEALKVDDLDTAETVLHLAKEEMEHVYDFLEKLAIYYAKQREYSVATSYAEQMHAQKGEFEQDRCYQKLSEVALQQNDFEQGMSYFNRIETSRARASTLISLARFSTELEWLESLLLLVDEVEDERAKDLARKQLAIGFARVGEYEQALALVEMMDTRDRYQALALVLSEYVQAGYVDEALQMLDQVKQPRMQARVLLAVARLYAEQGQMEQALQVAYELGVGPERDEAFAAIGAVCIQEGQLRYLPQIVQLAEEYDPETRIRYFLGKVLLEVGHLDLAYEYLVPIGDLHHSSRLLTQLATLRQESGHQEQALEILTALQEKISEETEPRQMAMYDMVVRDLVRHKQPELAMKLIRLIKEEEAVLWSLALLHQLPGDSEAERAEMKQILQGIIQRVLDNAKNK